MLSLCKRRRDTMKKRDEERKRWRGFHVSLDLILEILKKLPAKSLVRFQSVSKEWSVVIGTRRDFIDSIVTRSLPQKLPVFIFQHCLQPETFFTVSPALSLSTKRAATVPGSSVYLRYEYQYARGLICCYSSQSHLVTIYNPTTMQSLLLPKILSGVVPPSIHSLCHFGYDPVTNQYKVLYTITHYEKWNQTFFVFTLGSQSWRQIQDLDEKLIASVQGVCIDGIIYYGATRLLKKEDNTFGEIVLLSFNITSERFDHVWAPDTLLKAFLATRLGVHRTLVNYLGKLGCICCNEGDTSMWIMENAEKQEWSKVTFCLPQYPLKTLGSNFDINGFSGVTPTGEIFVTQCSYFFNKPLYVYYYNVKQNSFRRVEIQGTRPDKIPKESYRIRVFAIHDHVENTMRL